jgi:hypothetical protein
MSLQDEASRIAYAVGLREITPVILRLLTLEATAARQVEQITALQTSVLRLKFPNVQVVDSKEEKHGQQ